MQLSTSNGVQADSGVVDADVLHSPVSYTHLQFNLGVDQLAKNMLIRTWDGVKWSIDYYDGDCQLGGRELVAVVLIDVYKRQRYGMVSRYCIGFSL